MAQRMGELVTEPLEYDGGRPVTVYVPPDPVAAVVVAADGRWHTERLAEALEAAGISSTMIVGVHGCGDDGGRLREYVAGRDVPRFAEHERFLVDEVGRWVAARFGVQVGADRTAIWGASLGAELALAMGLGHPEVFGAVLAASPGAGFRPPDVLPDPPPRAYLVAGRQEPFFVANARRWAKALRLAGADVVVEQRDGGHGDAFWFEELPSMLAWAFGGASGR